MRFICLCIPCSVSQGTFTYLKGTLEPSTEVHQEQPRVPVAIEALWYPIRGPTMGSDLSPSYSSGRVALTEM